MIQPVGGDVHRERVMRGLDQRSGSLFSYVDLESRVRRDHPLRPIREIVNEVLLSLSGDFAALYRHRRKAGADETGETFERVFSAIVPPKRRPPTEKKPEAGKKRAPK